ncbi:unnamed protein product [Candidula unifasciata]|uniref:G-protein coupled receptors family 1 profile domain-containing protein n=1 Tax=Candidula unifasciata TaxID=100452 RepID=A0A8S3ZIL5_9EUPU|nr:unnamed protein product [Candidula unifasciata]
MSLNVDLAGTYLEIDQLSTPMSPNVTQVNGHLGRCDTNGTNEYEAFYNMAQFVSGLIIYPILCITGILGNTLSLIVLSHKDMATSTNIYLLGKLSMWVMYGLILVCVAIYKPCINATSFLYPQVSVCVTAWLTVAVSMDRYISVCYPSTSKTLCTIPKARTVVVSVFFIMILISIPSGFRYRLQTFNDTHNNVTCMELVVTELGRNKEFMLPYTWIHNFLRGIIPVFILVFLNARIINVLRKERVKGKKFSSRNRITLMLIAMVVVFIVCITPDAIMSTFFGKGYVEEDFLVKGIREITDSLVALNSAINFILYCSLSILFRNTFMRVFFGRRYVKMGGNSSRQVSRDGTTTHSLKRIGRNSERKRKSSCEKYPRSRQKNSISQIDFCYFEGNSDENSPKSEVITNGYNKSSAEGKLSNLVYEDNSNSAHLPLVTERNANDSRMTFSVYTGPIDMVKFPWETNDSKARVSVSQESAESEGIQL